MWSAPVTITGPASEPLTLEQVKEFLAIEDDETLHDAQLIRFIAAARAQVEAITGTRLVDQTVRVAASDWRDLRQLPVGPVQSVVEIVFDDVAGAEQALAGADWEMTGAGLARALRTPIGKGWPSGLRRGADTIRVTLEVGYDTVPEPVETAMLIMIADLFGQRESFAVGTVAAKVPSTMQVDHLLTNYRIWL